MKNSHIVLFSLLFANSFIFSANPAPDKKEKEKGIFDQCFDSPVGFAKCAAVGTIAGAATGAALWYSWGTAAPVADRIALGVSSLFEPSRPAPRSPRRLNPTPAPKKIESPKRAPLPAKQKPEEKKPDSPRRDDNKKSSWDEWKAPISAAAGFAGGIVVQSVASNSTNDVYDVVTGKKAKRDKEREEDLQIKREELAIQRQLLDGQMKIHEENRRMYEENRKMHNDMSEQHYKLSVVGGNLRNDMSNLSGKIDDVFMGGQQ